MKSSTLIYLRLAVGTLLLCALAPFAINLAILSPITLQSLMIILIPMLIGWRSGVMVTILYLLIGAAGLPVFANFNSGLAPFTGTSAGFLWGFPVVAFVAGRFGARGPAGYLPTLLLFLGCHLLLMLMGVIGFAVAGLTTQQILSTVTGLLPGLLIKSMLGALIVYLFRNQYHLKLQKSLASVIRRR